MLIPGKSHSRIKSCNSRVSVETLDFARERTFCSMIGVGSLVGAQGGAIAGRSLTVFLAHAGTPSIDRHIGGGTPKTSQNGQGRVWGSTTGEAQWPLAPGWRAGESPDAAGQLVDVAGGWARKASGRGWVSGIVGHLLKLRLGTWREDAIADRVQCTGNAQARRRTRPDDWPTSQWSFLFPIEADWSGCICTAGPMQSLN